MYFLRHAEGDPPPSFGHRPLRVADEVVLAILVVRGFRWKSALALPGQTFSSAPAAAAKGRISAIELAPCLEDVCFRQLLLAFPLQMMMKERQLDVF